MCLAVPMKIEAITGDMGQVDMGGAKREVSLVLLESPKVGEFVLVHAGFAIQRIDERQAEETLQLLNKISKQGQQG